MAKQIYPYKFAHLDVNQLVADYVKLAPKKMETIMKTYTNYNGYNQQDLIDAIQTTIELVAAKEFKRMFLDKLSTTDIEDPAQEKLIMAGLQMKADAIAKAIDANTKLNPTA